MGLKKYLNEQQQAELAALMMSARSNFARTVEIIEQATAGVDDEETQQRVGAIRQLVTALGFNLLFPSEKVKAMAMETARGLVEATFNGPAPDMRPAPTVQDEPPAGAGEEWSDTIE